MNAIASTAAAKVNLALAVTGRRDDGYHLLRSVLLRLALHDDLSVELDPAAAADSLFIDGDPEPAGSENLVLRAAAQLRAAIAEPLPCLRFRLTKRIPTAAGLGGGSSDAAAAMDLALAAWEVRLDRGRRLDEALRIGADVPFFSAAHAAALVSGVGEQLEPLPWPEPAAGVVLMTPPARLSTAAVFSELDRAAASTSLARQRVDELAGVLRESVDGLTLAATTAVLPDANDLWPPAVRLLPALVAARDAARAALGRAVLLSGSGPTLFAVYPSVAAAERAAEGLLTERPPRLEGAHIIATSTIGSGGTS